MNESGSRKRLKFDQGKEWNWVNENLKLGLVNDWNWIKEKTESR